MGIISKGNAATIATYLKSVEVRHRLGDTRPFVKVVCSSNEGGRTVRDIMKQYWEHGDGVFTNGAYFYSPDEDGGNTPLGFWKEFSVRPEFPPDMALEACNEIKQELADIIEGVSAGTITPKEPESPQLHPDPEEPQDDPFKDEQTKAPDYTYIVIGAAAAIIIALLLTWKRK